MGDLLLSLSSSQYKYWVVFANLNGFFQTRTGVHLSRVRMVGLVRIWETPATSVCVPGDTRAGTVKMVLTHLFIYNVISMSNNNTHMINNFLVEIIFTLQWFPFVFLSSFAYHQKRMKRLNMILTSFKNCTNFNVFCHFLFQIWKTMCIYIHFDMSTIHDKNAIYLLILLDLKTPQIFCQFWNMHGVHVLHSTKAHKLNTMHNLIVS